jgi:hypothetical protein
MPVQPTAIFRQPSTFAALNAAVAACQRAGFSVGAHQANSPCGLLLGDVTISKWRNMTAKEKGQLHGKIWGGRAAPITVMLNADASAAAVRAFAQVLAAAAPTLEEAR